MAPFMLNMRFVISAAFVAVRRYLSISFVLVLCTDSSGVLCVCEIYHCFTVSRLAAVIDDWALIKGQP